MQNNGLEITEVIVHKAPENSGPLVALARIVFNGAFVVNNIRIVKGKFGPFVSFPSLWDSKTNKGFQYAHPITKALQAHITEKVLRTYQAHEQEAAVIA